MSVLLTVNIVSHNPTRSSSDNILSKISSLTLPVLIVSTRRMAKLGKTQTVSTQCGINSFDIGNFDNYMTKLPQSQTSTNATAV